MSTPSMADDSSRTPSRDGAGARGDRPLRVGFLTYDLQRNTEDAVFEVARATPFSVKAFPLYRHVDQEVARVPYRPATAQCKPFGVDVKGSTPEGLAANPEWAVGLACARESDVVVLKGLLGPGAMWCAFCARLLGRVVISTNQTLPVRCEKKRRWWIRRLKRLLLRLCQYHIYQNPAAFEVLTEVYGCAPGRLISAPFEGGAALFRRLLSKAGPAEQSREVLGADARAIFLFVGTLLPFKGVPEIIRAAALLPESASFTCVFVGAEAPQAKKDGSIEHFTQLARSIGVEHRVRFLGPVTPEKLAEFYLASDAVLLPTQKDCFPKVLVEAALAGKPLITTTACGSAGLIVQDCANGFVIEPSDVDGLAQAMTKLLDPDLRARMGALSRRIVDQCCNMDLEVRGYVQAIERAAKHLHPRASA